MPVSFTAELRRSILFALAVLIALVFAGYRFDVDGVKAASDAPRSTKSHEEGLPNYDIRMDKTAVDRLAGFRTGASRSASEVADIRDGFAAGESELRALVPSLKVVYNPDIRTPEIIAPDAVLGKAVLSRSGSARRSDVLKEFLRENTRLVGVSPSNIDQLKVAADYTNPDGNLSFVELNQEINGIPVFRGEVKAGFTRSGEMFRVVNNLAPAVDAQRVSVDFGDAAAAVRASYGHINKTAPELTQNRAASNDKQSAFGNGDFATTAEKMYFPTEPGVAVPSWRVLIWQPVNAYYVIVDADTGSLLWRKNITEDQTQGATYNVYTNPNAMVNVADNPFPMTPGPTSPNGTQGPALPRTMITRIGNEAPYSFNNNGWITDGGNETDGNNVEAGLDRDTVNGVDLVNGRAIGAGRVFDFPLNPLDPNTNTGDNPTPPGEPVFSLPGDTTPGVCHEIIQPHDMVDAQRASITQLFYITNWFHDETYRLGFTEGARNFQHQNFAGQGGVGNDRVSAEGQDCSGVNNANFSTAADGTRGRMQMYLWTSPTPDIDGNLDADVVIHENGHGLSNRLHGNASGLSLDIARGMGEGWSDFLGHALLSEPSDPINAIYTTGSYDTYLAGPGINNYYYGIRRFPKAVKAFTGGAQNRPHNPLTFADIDATQINLGDGAFAPRFVGTADQVHNIGEVWSIALWEIRARMIERLGWAAGNRRVLQFVLDGMKLAPLNPTPLSERDAMISAALASGTAADVSDMWAGFAIRGFGAQASIQNAGGVSSGGLGTVRVTQSFDLPNLVQTPTFSVSDVNGDNDGSFEPGETLTLTVPLSNTTGAPATGVTLHVVGGSSADYGTIASGQTASRDLTFTVPAETACGVSLPITFNVSSNLGPATFVRSILIGTPEVTFTENFDSVTAPGIPAGWTVTSSYAPMTWVSTSTGPDTAPNSMFAADLPNCTGSCPTTNGGSTELISPAIPVEAGAALLKFRHRFNTEGGWDGGVLEISIAEGAFQDIVAAGGEFLANGYNSSLGVSTPNPLGGRPAWSGTSSGYIETTARMPANAAGQNVRLRWRMGTDSNTAPANGGWNVDTVSVMGSFSCSTAPAGRARADFDGDGRSDLSVFRPSNNNWFLDRTRDGLQVVNFGLSADLPTPGDFDGDGRTDVAVWRPTNGVWYRINSTDQSFYAENFGIAGDQPQSGDFDGDGRDDIAVFRPSTGVWYWRESSTGADKVVQFGAGGDIPAAGDYDGDNRQDLVVFRPSNGIWYRYLAETGQYTVTFFGLANDVAAQADYDGDGREDIAVFRPSNGVWYWLSSGSSEAMSAVQFGQAGDVIVPGDYDGDGRDDQAVFRNGVWYINRSASAPLVVQFGLPGDIAVPNRYVQ